MEIIKRVTNSNILSDIFDLPDNMKNRKVIVTLVPYAKKNDSELKDLKGVLSKYKNIELIEKEKNAWADSVVDRYENS